MISLIGGKKIDTRTRIVRMNKAVFNERFAMKTLLDYDFLTGEYEPKPVSIHHQ